MGEWSMGGWMWEPYFVWGEMGWVGSYTAASAVVRAGLLQLRISSSRAASRGVVVSQRELDLIPGS